MNTGIIGAGRIGGSLTRLLAAVGHPARVSNSRAAETLADLVAETGAAAVWAAEAAADPDLVIVSIHAADPTTRSAGLFGLLLAHDRSA